jgi:polar amino acid transport system substrate-binding protein
MEKLRRFVALPIAALVLAACQAGSAEITNVVCVGEATTYLDWLNGDLQPDTEGTIEQPSDTAGDLLETIQEAGVIRVATDANYEPQSFREPDGSWAGFDIDVAAEIADRLGVDVEYQHQEWDLITAGSWSERWDISVGSMTITTDRKDLFSFAQPYYYTPAYLAASERSGVTATDDLDFELPTGGEAVTRPTDANCIEEIEAGRTEFDLVITSGTVIDAAIAAESPIVKIGEPIYIENLAVAIDKAGPEHAALLYEINRIIGEMHEDGTLTQLSEEWFDGADLTQDPAEG